MISPRLADDLKLLTVAQLDEKYGEHPWGKYYSGNSTVDLEPLAAQRLQPGELLPVVPDLPEEEDPIAAPPYKGRAFGKFVMIRRLESEHSGRLVMPERISGTSDVGWVASVGEDVKYIKKGDLVLFDQYCSVGRECRLLDGEGLPGDFLLAEEPDILAILEKVR
jgi:co-chaperonin GroES (HSP10)